MLVSVAGVADPEPFLLRDLDDALDLSATPSMVDISCEEREAASLCSEAVLSVPLMLALTRLSAVLYTCGGEE